MTAIDTTRVAPTRVINPLGRVFAAFSAWLDARATRAALSQLTDRELADIGLSRCDIDRVSARA